ncbi:MAG: response regulator [Clostridiaceae bacterium]
MYKVVIVEDEPWALIGITKTFKWGEMGFEVIAQSTSAREAIDIIHKKSPDVVFTDIRMPQMSGIELMRKIRSECMDIEFVIISGFAEFEYAREAITLGAFEYCLKPISQESANSILSRLAIHIENKRDKRDIELFDTLVLRNDNARIEPYAIGLPCKNTYYQGISVIGMGDMQGQGGIDLPESVDSLRMKLGKRKYFYIANVDHDLYSTIKPNDVMNGYIGLSGLAEGLQSFRKLFIEADKAATANFMFCRPGIYRYSKAKTDVLNKKLGEIFANIRNPDTAPDGYGLRNFNEIFEAENACIDAAVYFWNQISSYLKRNDDYLELHGQLEFLDYEDLPDRFANAAAMLQYLESMVKSCTYEIKNERDNKVYNENFKKLLEYIDMNYIQKLQLKDLAEMFYLNPNYCCYLFKNILQKSFSEYLTDKRMTKACDFLKDVKLPISEVAVRAGYSDYYYFNKTFKKQFGYTPLQYRQRQQ